MLVLAALVASIGLVDSLNPSTVGPALLLALGANAKRDLAAFLLGVFGTSTLGGLILVLGPGRALLAIASTPRPHIVHLVEVVVGVMVLVAAVVLWLKREGFARRLSAQSDRTRFSPLALGAVIIVAEFRPHSRTLRRWLRSSRHAYRFRVRCCSSSSSTSASVRRS